MKTAIVLCALTILAAGLALRAEIIDRVAVTVDTQVIAQSLLILDIRVTAFLNGAKLDLGPGARKDAARRLVEQALMRREMDLARYPQPPPAEVDQMLERVKKSRFRSETDYRAALVQYGVTEDQLKDSLRRQAAMMQFIEFRFRPEVLVTDAEIRACWETRIVPVYEARHQPLPPYDEARDQCEDIVAAQRVDQLVDAWMKQARARVNIVYQEDAFR